MSDTVVKLAAKLAEDVVDVQDATGETRLFVELGEVIGAASQTLEEAFMTEVRIRLAERVARKYLDAKIAELSAKAASQT